MTAYPAAAEIEIDYDPLAFLDEINSPPVWPEGFAGLELLGLRTVREQERRGRKNRARRVLRERRARARGRRRGWRP